MDRITRILVLPSGTGIKNQKKQQERPFFPWESIHQNLLFWASVRSWANEIIRCEKLCKLEDYLSLYVGSIVYYSRPWEMDTAKTMGVTNHNNGRVLLCVISRNNGIQERKRDPENFFWLDLVLSYVDIYRLNPPVLFHTAKGNCVRLPRRLNDCQDLLFFFFCFVSLVHLIPMVVIWRI